MASLCKRPRSPFWWAFWRDEHGKAFCRSTKQRNKKDARRVADLWEDVSKRRRSATHLRDVFNQLYRDAFGRDLPRTNFRQYSDKWLSEKKVETSAATLHAYTTTVNRFRQFLGEHAEADLALISRDDLLRWRSELASHIHHVTANRHLRVLRLLFKCAKRDGFLTENPAETIAAVAASKSGSQEPDRRPFSPAEIQALIALASDEWRSLIRFGFFTGQRLGDLAALRWSGVDLAKNEIRFVARKTNRRVVLPIPEPLREHILSLATPDDPNAPLHPHAFDLVTRYGRVSSLSGEFAQLLVATGLRRDATPHNRLEGGRSARRRKEALSFHSLRHSASTVLSEAGVPASVAQAFIATIPATFTRPTSPSE
jgi:integrase